MYPSSVTAQSGLCRTRSETPKTAFLMTRPILCLINNLYIGEKEFPEPLITWKAAVNRVPWGIVFLLGSGFCIANGSMVSENSKQLKRDRTENHSSRTKVPPDLHLTYIKNGGNLGLVLNDKKCKFLRKIICYGDLLEYDFTEN